MSWEQKVTGKTVVNVVVGKNSDDNDIVTIKFTDGSYLTMQHYQDCCEGVVLEDYSLDELLALKGQKLVSAYETTDYQTTEYGDQCYTFYSIQGDSSSATLRWYGESNGYYSVKVIVEFYDSKT